MALGILSQSLFHMASSITGRWRLRAPYGLLTVDLSRWTRPHRLTQIKHHFSFLSRCRPPSFCQRSQTKCHATSYTISSNAHLAVCYLTSTVICVEQPISTLDSNNTFGQNGIYSHGCFLTPTGTTPLEVRIMLPNASPSLSCNGSERLTNPSTLPSAPVKRPQLLLIKYTFRLTSPLRISDVG